MKKVLIVSFYFPPFEGIASLRAGKFAKFLPHFGWEPLILTIDKIPGLNPSLKIEVDERNIFRTRWFDLFSYLKKATGVSEDTSVEMSTKSYLKKMLVKLLKKPFEAGFVRLPDRTAGWIHYAVKQGEEIIENEKVDAIFSTSGPASPHFIASKLTRKYNLPWVADFRDLWSGNYFFPRNKVFDGVERLIEKQVLRRAKVITAVTWGIAGYLKRVHQKQVEVITNGYDEEDYETSIEKVGKGGLRIVYTGNIYEGKRDQPFFFEGVRDAIREMKVRKGELLIEFYSALTGRLNEIILKFGLSDFIKIRPFLPYSECVKVQKEADVLLLLEYVDRSTKLVIPGKTFEYLGARRPIFAVAPRGGDLERVITETRCGWIASNKDEVKKVIVEIIQTFKEKGEIPYNAQFVKQFTRKEGARKLADILNSLIP